MIGVHAPEDGRKEETEKLYNMLQKEVDNNHKRSCNHSGLFKCQSLEYCAACNKHTGGKYY